VEGCAGAPPRAASEAPADDAARIDAPADAAAALMAASTEAATMGLGVVKRAVEPSKGREVG
jgi:hypothetical protein